MDQSIEKAERLIQIRKLAKLSRKDMAEIAGVSTSTYKGWENARFGGIPQKRAAILVEALQAEGIKSSTEWIINGLGENPQKVLYHQITQLQEVLVDKSRAQNPETIEQLRIKAELEFFCNNNDWNTLYLTVSDDAMSPYFLPGDLVAGIKISDEQLNKIFGLNCIVRTKNNKTLLRQVQKSNTHGLFTLLSLNFHNKQHLVLQQDVELIDIAPVVWFRRKKYW